MRLTLHEKVKAAPPLDKLLKNTTMKLKKYFLGMAAVLTVVGMSSCKGDYDD